MKDKILVVDDSSIIRDLLTNYLEHDFEVTTAESPLVALKIIHEGYIPDLIITDYHMPKMNGYEFLLDLRQNRMLHDIPVVVLSKDKRSEVKIQFLREGARDYISKPFNPEELKLRIKKQLIGVEYAV